jgi:hypothetical protein
VIPRIVVVLPVEGRATAYVLAATYEDERRLALDLLRRDVLADVLDAVVRLSDTLAADEEEASG